MIVILAGVMVNLIVGVLLFAMVIHHYEKEYIPNNAVTDGVYAFEAARNMGFESGDKIVSVNGKTFERFEDAISPKMFFGSIVTVNRNGQNIDIVMGDSAYEIMKTSSGQFLQPFNFPAKVDSVMANTAAAKAGMQAGDIIIALDTIAIPTYGAWIEYRMAYADNSTNITYLRGNDTITSSITLDTNAMIGIAIASAPYQFKPYSILQSVKYGWNDAMSNLWMNIKGFGKIFSGKEKITALSGPVGIAKIYGKVWNWYRFWSITGLISIILAFMNVLPIPGLDGGHAIFTLVELVTGKKVPDSVLQYAQSIGMILLLLLMVFVIGNDIFKLFM
ncbi:MAG: RIP metalloprotease RseP [Bacteroidales bacterium]|nr:RIP metalloprotease RseP [Bacteroidales bacterium]